MHLDEMDKEMRKLGLVGLLAIILAMGGAFFTELIGGGSLGGVV